VPKKVEQTVPTVPKKVEPTVPIVPQKVEATLPNEFYEGDWPVFNQNKMKLAPPKATTRRAVTGIAINEFNMFRRRLPGIAASGSAQDGESSYVEGLDSQMDTSSERGSLPPPIISERVAGPPRGGGGSTNGILIMGAIFVVLYLFQ
jgi:hypothetical protein